MSLAIFVLASGSFGCDNRYSEESAKGNDVTKESYLAFQIFTYGDGPSKQVMPDNSGKLKQTVISIRDRIGMAGQNGRHLGFITGPIALDQTDEQVSSLIVTSFVIALQTDVATGFHIDHGMFWDRLTELNSTESIEWTDWEGTPNTGLRLDWSSKPVKIEPQLCFNSQRVKSAVASRANLIGLEIAKGLKRLHYAGKEHLFIGVIAGWETFIGRAYNTGKRTGYHALRNAGYSKGNPPADINLELGKITTNYLNYWAQNLIKGGVPSGKIFSHIAPFYEFNSSGKINRTVNPEANNLTTPPEVAFGDNILPGFSTYPVAGELEQLRKVLNLKGNPKWASCEGTAIDPGQAATGGQGMTMEGYLGNLFNHGASLVNVFGWDVGDTNNPFRKIAESDESIAAYRKFLKGDSLKEEIIKVPDDQSGGLQSKIREIQEKLPGYVNADNRGIIEPLIKELDGHLRNKEFKEAVETADKILELLKNTE